MKSTLLCSTALRCILPTLLLGASSLLAGALVVPPDQTLTAPNTLSQLLYPNAQVDVWVTPESNLLRYEYLITYPATTGNGKGKDEDENLRHPNLGHFIVALPQVCTSQNGCIGQPHIYGALLSSVEIGTFEDQGNSNPGIPNPTYGMKVNISPINDEGEAAAIRLSFLSNRSTTSGTIYGKGASGGYFYSTNAIVPGSSIWKEEDPSNPVPEPGTYALLGAGLLSMGLLSRRKKQ